MRLFIAIRLSDEMQSVVADTLHQLKLKGVKGSYVPKQNLHLTLAFIGETTDSAPIKEAMRQIKYKPFHLSMSEMGNFGDLLWIGLKGNQGLSGVVRDLRSALDSAGIAYDKKKFVPHITIIRKMTGNRLSVPAPKGEMMVRSISLMKSEVKNGKRVYTEIFAV